MWSNGRPDSVPDVFICDSVSEYKHTVYQENNDEGCIRAEARCLPLSESEESEMLT